MRKLLLATIFLVGSSSFALELSDFVNPCGKGSYPTGCEAPDKICTQHNTDLTKQTKQVSADAWEVDSPDSQRQELTGIRLDMSKGFQAALICKKTQAVFCPNQLQETCCTTQCRFLLKKKGLESLNTCFYSCVGG